MSGSRIQRNGTKLKSDVFRAYWTQHLSSGYSDCMRWHYLSTVILVIIGLVYAHYKKLGIEKTLAINSARAMVQLILLGYALLYILQIKDPMLLFSILLVMITFGSYTAQTRVKLVQQGFRTAFLSIFLGSATVIFTLLAMKVLTLKANELIPISGMIIGQALNVYTIMVDRMKGEVRNTIDIIENKIALGATIRQALDAPFRDASRAGFIPIMNSLQTVGIVFIPGMTTGLLVGGADPLKAVSYQIVVMYMMVGVALFTTFFSTFFVCSAIIPTALAEPNNNRKG